LICPFFSPLRFQGGDTAFCGKECRQEQVEIDEAKEKKLEEVTRPRVPLLLPSCRENQSRPSAARPYRVAQQ